MGRVTVIRNGPGREARPIADLVRLLATEPLNPCWEEKHGGFVSEETPPHYPLSERAVRFCGSFARVKHPFIIVTDDPELARLLAEAIRRNRAMRRRAEMRRRSLAERFVDRNAAA